MQTALFQQSIIRHRFHLRNLEMNKIVDVNEVPNPLATGTMVKLNIETLKSLGLKRLEDIDLNGGNRIFISSNSTNFS